jgi:hypothetical protein
MKECCAVPKFSEMSAIHHEPAFPKCQYASGTSFPETSERLSLIYINTPYYYFSEKQNTRGRDGVARREGSDSHHDTTLCRAVPLGAPLVVRLRCAVSAAYSIF